MPIAAHLQRRGAVYYWRRKTPSRLVPCYGRRHLIVSLRTANHVHARALAIHLDALIEELLTMPEPAILTGVQLDAMFAAYLRRHSEKLDRVAAAEKTERGFNRDQAVRDDQCTGWVYRFFEAQGPSAVVGDQERSQLEAAGLTATDIAAVEATLAHFRKNGVGELRRPFLEPFIKSQGAEPTPMNLAQAHQVYLRAMAAALFATDRRYGGIGAEDADLAARIMKAAVEQRAAAVQAAGGDPQPGARAAVAAPREAPSTPAPPAVADPPLAADGILELGAAVCLVRKADGNWTDETYDQNLATFALFDRFLREDCKVVRAAELRQAHLAKFVTFLRTEIYRHYGKSVRDQQRTIAELREIAKSKSEDSRGIGGSTLNRHMTALNQLFEFAPTQGVKFAESVSTAGLRARKTRNARERNVRATLTTPAAEHVFQAAPFTGCLSWEKPRDPGHEMFHRALYFVPLLLYYQGGRREEFCGLSTDDVISDNGPIPYAHIGPNAFRRLKNGQSERNAALHPEIIRLGFLDYCEAIKRIGYKRLFPDLFSPTTNSPLGDRLYDEFKPILAAADTDEQGFVIHSIRRGFGNALKQRRVTEEQRGDLLGHGGKSEAAERYCAAYEIEALHEFVQKIPVVTAHLTAQPIRLLPWVEAKESAPFSRPHRSKRLRPATKPIKKR